jgi:hypothetical protein
VALGVVWGALVLVAFVGMARLGQAAGALEPAPAKWPAGVALARTDGRPVMVVALHPECPCSRATVSELERLLAGRAGEVDVHVLFVRPQGLARDPVLSSLWSRVVKIPGVTARVDDGGSIAAAFHALTSGQVLLYDGSGALRFSGGITASRGHEGDSAGREAVAAALDGRPAAAGALVFGCSLFGGNTR